jgi:hypothetical protein
MENIIKNKKKLVLTIAVITIMIMTTIPTVIAPPPGEKPLRDFDWNHWNNIPHMFSMVPGNIGIGTPKPQEKLTVSPSSNFAVEMQRPQNVVASGDYIGGGLPAGTYYFRIAASDGIGTTIPSLEVNYTVDGIIEDMIRLEWDPVQGAEYYIVYKGAEEEEEDRYITCNVPMYEYSTDSGFTPTGGPLPKETTAFVNKISADGDSWFNGGNVGIGTTTPETLLDVLGVIQIRSSSGFGRLQIKREDINQVWTEKIRNDGAFVIHDQTNDLSPIVIEEDSKDNAIYIDSSGQVGINTLDPDRQLHVNGYVRIASRYEYSNDKTGYLSIPAAAFTQTTSYDDDYYNFYPDGGFGYIGSGSGTYDVDLMCPVYLPEGATITKFTVFYYDNDDDAGEFINLDFKLKSKNNEYTNTITMGHVSKVSTDSENIQNVYDTVSGFVDVNYNTFQYYISGTWEQVGTTGSTLRFYGCQIEYTLEEVPI